MEPPSRVGHVRIESLLARGGMGAVYLGFDEKLERRVAVKMLQAEKRLGTAARARFLREARILSKLDHPNICRIYDLVETGGSDILLLEYIAGETLAKAAPRLSHLEKLAVAITLADVLAAAHREGIVHRDLKPENVMLTPEGIVKVLDFGIARSLHRDAAPIPAAGPPAPAAAPEQDATAALAEAATPVARDATWDVRTIAGSIVGTLRYMSPEQARGEEATPASDVYSLGVLLQELFTGERAYAAADAETLLELVRQGKTRAPAGLDGPLAALLRELQSPDASRRPAAQEADRRLRQIASAPAVAQRRRRLALAGSALVLALAGTALLSYRLARPGPYLPRGERPRVAVLPFRNASGDASLGWAERGLPPMLAEALGSHAGVDVVPVAQVSAVAKESALGPGPLTDATVRRINRELGSNLVVQTEVRRGSAGFELFYRLYEDGGSTTKSVAGADLTESAALLSRHLALLLAPEGPRVELKDRFSVDPYANASYAMGLDQLDSAGPKSAQHYFEVCLIRDPGFLWARMKLAECLHKLGAGDEGEKLLADVLAAARSRGDRRLEADVLRGMGTAAYDRGDFDASKKLLGESLAVSEGLHDSYALAETLNNLASNAYRKNDMSEAERLWTAVLERARALGNHKREGGVLNNLGAVAFARGDTQTAERQWLAALAIMREIESRAVAAAILGNLAVIESGRGHLDKAESYEREVVALQRQAGDRHGEALALFNLSETAYAKGDLAEARALAGEGLAAAQQAKDRFVEAHLLAGLAEYEAESGELASALARLEAAEASLVGLDSPEAVLAVCGARVSVMIRAGRLEDARRATEKARALDPEASATLVGQARLAYARGASATAVELFEKVKAHAESWGPHQEAELAEYRKAAAHGRR